MASNYRKPVYMTKLRESRLRHLPPMTPIRETSGIPGTSDTKASGDTKPNVLALDTLPEEYRYLALDSEPLDPRRKQWHPDDVNDVVQHYLRAATHGGNPQEPQPTTLCKCCNDVNNENKRRKNGGHTHAQLERPLPYPVNHGHPPMPGNAMYKPPKYEETKTNDYSAALGVYRTESPELLSDSRHVPDYEDVELDRRKIFVTHPAKNSLYTNWGVRTDLEQYGHQRLLAEDVVQASSNFIDSMEKLKKISTPR